MTVTELKEILERIEQDGQGERKIIFSGYDAYNQCADEHEIDDFIYRDEDALSFFTRSYIMKFSKCKSQPKEFFELPKVIYCPECGSQQRQISADHKIFSCDSCCHSWRIR